MVVTVLRMCVAVELDDAGTPAEFDVEAVRVLDDCGGSCQLLSDDCGLAPRRTSIVSGDAVLGGVLDRL